MASISPPSMAQTIASLDSNKVKVVVLGEAGVGKTTLVQSIKGKPVKNPPWTIGCSVELISHSYKVGTPEEMPYFTELWDIGGSRSHRNARKVFYQSIHGLILVHDLTNRKSEENLNSWLTEVLTGESGQSPITVTTRLPTTVFDGEQFVTEKDIPILIVGCKLDQQQTAVGAKMTPNRSNSKIATDCNADEIFLDARQPISPGSTNGVKLSRFFDRVIERQYHDRKKSLSASGSFDFARRRRMQFM